LKFVAAGGAALVIVVAVFGWLFMGGSAPAEQPKAQVPEVQQPSQPEQQSVSTFSDQNSSNANEAPFISETVTVDGKTETKQATKEKKPTPAPTKTPEKKKVTVDDLINDN
jgi:cytoskeletal protein RodZ